MALLNKLENLRTERKRRAKGYAEVFIGGEKSFLAREYTEMNIDRDRKLMKQAVEDSSILDSYGEYQIINHLMRADSLGHHGNIKQDISLVTQTSLSQVQHLPLMAKRWSGLISVSLFSLASDIDTVIEAIILLRKCHPLIRHNANFHLVFPLRVPPPKTGSIAGQPTSVLTVTKSTSCADVDTVLETLDSSNLNYDLGGVAYPNNLLRNVARRNSMTFFVLVVDIDLIVNEGLRADFMKFAEEQTLFAEKKKSDKVVYVLPAYEVKAELPDSRIPKDKNELIERISNNEARPFYFELCWNCQKHTDYNAWQLEPQAAKLALMYEALWRDPWEPFYISRNNVPFYDERFRQYGFNRISQVCELHVSGYRFSILNNAFVVHKGWKSPDSFHSDKDAELEKNRMLFRQFKAELKERYPDSTRRCY
ncbi:Beta-1,4-glucuronyltransferase 1 [Halotydeus destructor]|nr:Beta-1,4-glucuronyltransferase 1 [Halotydeus destructor]